MDRVEAVLLVAEQALEEIRELRQQIDRLKTAPKRAVSFCVDDAGHLIVTDEGKAEDLGCVRGAAGPIGQKGLDGTSVDLQAIDRDIVARIDKVVSEIRVPADGAPGRDGINGEDGKSVDVEAIEREVSERLEKAIADIPTPRDGRDGKIGPPGRDALQLEILPAIDPVKNYPRGTYAHHRGGVWHATKATDGMEGWHCIVEGVAEVTEEITGKRQITRTTVLSSGLKSVLTFKFTNFEDCGVYKQGSEYEKGDGVTWGGCFWLAQSDGELPVPGSGENNGWRLAVKKGSEGKSAFQIARSAGFHGSEREWLASLKGERGLSGKDGRP